MKKRWVYFAIALATIAFISILGNWLHESGNRIKMAPEISEGQAAARESLKVHASEDFAGGAGGAEPSQTTVTGEVEHAEPSQPVAAEESEHEELIEPVTVDRAEYEEIIQELLQENQGEISEWFEKYPLWQRWVDFSCFDFTGDGLMEVILSYTYVENSTPVSYNYVYDVERNFLFGFASVNIYGHEIYVDNDTDTFYIRSHLHIGADHDVTIYEEITREGDWDVEIILVEWDCRDGRGRSENEQDGYHVYTDFTQEEEDGFMRKDYMEGMNKVMWDKEVNGTAQQISEYDQIYENLEMREFVYLGYINEWETGMQ